MTFAAIGTFLGLSGAAAAGGGAAAAGAGAATAGGAAAAGAGTAAAASAPLLAGGSAALAPEALGVSSSLLGSGLAAPEVTAGLGVGGMGTAAPASLLTADLGSMTPAAVLSAPTAAEPGIGSSIVNALSGPGGKKAIGLGQQATQSFNQDAGGKPPEIPPMNTSPIPMGAKLPASITPAQKMVLAQAIAQRNPIALRLLGIG